MYPEEDPTNARCNQEISTKECAQRMNTENI